MNALRSAERGRRSPSGQTVPIGEQEGRLLFKDGVDRALCRAADVNGDVCGVLRARRQNAAARGRHQRREYRVPLGRQNDFPQVADRVHVLEPIGRQVKPRWVLQGQRVAVEQDRGGGAEGRQAGLINAGVEIVSHERFTFR